MSNRSSYVSSIKADGPPRQLLKKRRAVYSESHEESVSGDKRPPPKKRRKIIVEVVVSPPPSLSPQQIPQQITRIGPPRHIKSVSQRPPRQQITRVGPPKNAKPAQPPSQQIFRIGPPKGAKSDKRPPSEDLDGRVIENDMFWGYNMSFQDGVVPETQSPHGPASPMEDRPSSSAVPALPPTSQRAPRPIAKISSGSLISRMRPRPSMLAVDSPIHASPVDDIVDDPEPPLSSIEQFSPPEKSSSRAVERVIIKAKRDVLEQPNNRNPMSRKDDQVLRLRGQRLAEEAVRRRPEASSSVAEVITSRPSSKSYDWLFTASRSPSPAESPQVPPDTDSVAQSDMLDPGVTADDLSRQMEDAYVDFDGGQQPAEALSMGRPLPGPKPKVGPLQEARLKISQTSPNKSATMESPDEFPLTSTTQRADVDSQSQEHSIHSSQMKELTLALEDKSLQIAKLEHEKSDVELRVAELEAENKKLSEAHQLSAAQLDAAIEETREVRVQFEQEVSTLRRKHASYIFEMETKVDTLKTSVDKLRHAQESAEKERELFREFYRKASAHASEVGTEKAELERQHNVTTGQLKEGLPMLKSMYEDRLKKLQEELDKWKAQCKVLTDKDERTNDDVRRKAALEAVLRDENESLKLELEQLRTAADAQPQPQPQPVTPPVDGEPLELGDATCDGDPPADESEQLVYLCEYVPDASSHMCNAHFCSSEEVVQHALNEHYPELKEITV
ncbi:uncharacterized protein FIBRA_05236 [Fibroporia radiculosa]|uniref:C2H2-type domain-containing protein n=1 Tax=Fibroporia radiculosa TaxID=599839 RepID=J4GQM0_9APHY|nr:uncharacterized protein FIBRA_05236 [Fibroporia radiculosa]CCM03115.1 predicted protein [Fibroporia radiculosa]